MADDDRGPLLFSYYPIPANPMSVALALLLGVVAFGFGPLVGAASGLWPLGGACFLPLAVVLLAMLAFKPSPTLVFEEGIEVSRPLWRRLARTPRYLPWASVRDVYPASYEVAGSFLSPFASSAGTLVHTGIGLETTDGRRLLVKFTPGTIRSFRAESPGYVGAMGAIRERFSRAGVPMVTTARPLADADVLRMQEQAREPLVSIAGVFLAFFLPPSVVAAVLLAAPFLAVEQTAPFMALLAAAALAPPAASMLRTLRRSERRNAILTELAKHEESLRERPAASGRP